MKWERKRLDAQKEHVVGYFGRARRDNGAGVTTRVHLVEKGGATPVCGAPLHPDQRFHWCGPANPYTVKHYVGCRRCAEIWRRSH